MKETAVAKRYSNALFLALQEMGSDSSEAVCRQLSQVVKLVSSNEEIKTALQSPLVPMAQKKNLLRESLSSIIHDSASLLYNFLDLVVYKKRMQLLPLILMKFEKRLEESKETMKATVKCAFALNERSIKSLEQKLSQLFKKKVLLETSVQSELLAGLVVQAGDTVIDNSLRTQLENMKRILN